MSGDPKSTGWRWIGCGCGGVMVTVMLVIVFFSIVSYNRAQRLENELAFPEARAASTAKVLGFTELPEGYRPFGAFAIPLFLEMAVLTDLTDEELTAIDIAEPGERFRERGFIFMSALRLRRDDTELRRYFEEGSEIGEAPGPDFEVGFEGRESLGRGEMAIPGGEALWVTRRGELTLAGRERPGLASLFYLDCDGDGRLRFALWFTPDPGGEGLTGTPADPEAIEEFLGHFSVC